MKLDVLIVTKRNSISFEFERMIENSNIPVNRIIIETSKPLGPARERAIQKAETERFVWLDDDVYLPENWYNSLMKYWNNDMGWLEGLALPRSPKWYADWCDNALRKDIRYLKLNERSFNCCAIVVTDALKCWHYPKGEYLGFGSEDFLMSNHVTMKGYSRARVPIVADHRINYGASIWHHISSGTKSLGRTNHDVRQAIKYSGSCLISGSIASIRKRNPEIFPNAVRWAWCWFRDLGL